MEPEGSLPRSRGPTTGPYPEPLPRSFQRKRPVQRPCVTFRDKLVFRAEKFLAAHPPPLHKLEDHPLSAVTIAYSIFPQVPSISGGRLLFPQPKGAPCPGDRDPCNMDYFILRSATGWTTGFSSRQE
jgi:hypothetical protein